MKYGTGGSKCQTSKNKKLKGLRPARKGSVSEMVRCVAITNSNRRCKKQACYNEFCCSHGTIPCVICEKDTVVKDRHTMENCRHVFCKECLSKEFYNKQWFDGFSTENAIKCPECSNEVGDYDWSFITDYLCKSGFLQRKMVYDTYLSPVYYKDFHGFIKLEQEYSRYEINEINKILHRKINQNVPFEKRKYLYWSEEISVVYFEKHRTDRICYRFFYGDVKIKNLFLEFQKELIEHVFHPSRVQKFSELYNLGPMGYLEVI
jgi:hypothetical protein